MQPHNSQSSRQNATLCSVTYHQPTTNKYPFTRHTPGELGLPLITFKSGCPGCLPNWFSLLHEGFSHALNINKFVLYLQIFKKFRNMQSRYHQRSLHALPPNPPPFLEFPRRTGNQRKSQSVFIMADLRTCESSGCNQPAKLQCPTCIKLGIQGSFFCAQVDSSIDRFRHLLAHCVVT